MSTSSNFWHLNLPHVRRAIVEYTDPKTRCRLSRCSKDEQYLVNNTSLSLRRIDYFVKDYDRPHRLCVTLQNSAKYDIYDFEQTHDVIQCLIYLLKSPNTCEFLDFYDSHPSDPQQDAMSRLIQELALQNITPKIRVVKWVNTPGDIFIDFFTKLDVEYLEGCYVHSTQETREQIDRLVETEQWKKLRVVQINGVMDSTWCIEDVLEKPMFLLNIAEIGPPGIRRIIGAFRRRNHPVGSCFHVAFRRIPAMDVCEEHAELIEISNNEKFYLKTFPMPDEENELRVQFFQFTFRNLSFIKAISGIVTPKNQVFEHCDVWSKITHSLRDS